MRNRMNLFTGASLGAIATYFMDPDRGRRRRAGVRDRIAHLRHALPHQLDLIARDMSHRTEGTIAEVRNRLRPHSGDQIDDVIEDRVRSALGRVVSHPHAIQVCSDGGVVTLSGVILAHELTPLLRRTERVKGVRAIDNRLEAHQDDEHIPSLQGGVPRHRGHRLDVLHANWAPSTRMIMGAVGSSLVSGSFLRQTPLPFRTITGALGLLILSRSITNIETKRLLGFGGRRAMKLRKTMQLDAPIQDVFGFWREFENFPLFMTAVMDVRTHGDKHRSHWTIRGPAGRPIHFDAEVTRSVPNQLLAWKTLPGSLIRHAGQVRFFPGERGTTKIELDLSYNPPAGILGYELAKLLGMEPKKRIEEALYQMKQLIEQGPSPRQARGRARLKAQLRGAA